ncbi:MAG: serine hydrolase [Xanthobacteraceae bacterium]
MGWVSIEARRGLRSGVVVLAAMVAAFAFTTNTASARHHHRGHFRIARHESRHQSSGHTGGYNPPTASIMVDGNTGAVLEESNPDALRHPASLSKVMTLYLLFERLDAGQLRLDSRLTVSAHAAAQAPTKLGLKPGQTISVEDAIEGIVTRSANDAAVVIAENLGGSEQAFAKMMTQKARALGMSRTAYVNASGLPDDRQITTARDLARLALAIEQRFPRYYKFFSTTSFVFRGQTIRGHDHLLGSVPGVDGMKTGFTDGSGFNLMTSVHRDGRYLIGIVLGGRTAAERDAHMRALIEANIRLASARHTAPHFAERTAPNSQRQQGFEKVLAKEFAAEASQARPDPTPTAGTDPRVIVGSNDPIRPVVVKTITYRAVTVRAPSMKPMPVLVPVVPTRPAPFAAAQQPPVQLSASTLPVETPPRVVASAGPMPSVAAPARMQPSVFAVAKAEPDRSETANLVQQSLQHAHSGWVIQIGAYGGEDEARQHLNEAQAKLHAMLASADPFTERVQKGDTTFYRARFAGFDKSSAEAACRQLKRNDFACITLKD